MRRLLTVLLAVFAATTSPLRAHDQLVVDAGRGPVTVYIPDSYDPGSPLPVVLLLHGYTSTGALMENWLKLLDVIDEKEFIYAHPDGTADLVASQFWNATNACCNFFGSPVNDSAYLANLLDEIEATLAVDPLRVHIAGHSNGGFMAHRMACDHAERLASIASIAGATWNNRNTCSPDSPVHVLQIHGTQDGVIGFNGGSTGAGTYPGAQATVQQWANFAGCLLTGVLLPLHFDYDSNVAGAETDVTLYEAGCEPGGSAELWRMTGSGHLPGFNSGFTSDLIDWLLAHPKTPAPVAYCTAGTSAAGCNALLASSGTPDVGASSGFVVSASHVEGAKDGLFFYGFSGPQANTWGNGSSFQCVTPPVLRAGLLAGGGVPGTCTGSFSQDFNAYWSTAPVSKQPAPGSEVWMQLWYRDPQNTSNQTTSLSNALAITVTAP